MRVLIVDDHPLFRAGIRALLAGLDPGGQADEAGSVAEVIERASAGYETDLILLDMNLPGVDRIDAVRLVRSLFEATPLVVVSADDDAWLIRAAIDAGASGYIPKTTDAALTVQALRLVLAHGVYLPASALGLPGGQDRRGATDAIGAAAGAGAHGALAASSPAAGLSARQREVLHRLLQGKSNKVIARELDIAEGTVKAHLWAVYQALGVGSRTQALYRAHELGLLDGALRDGRGEGDAGGNGRGDRAGGRP